MGKEEEVKVEKRYIDAKFVKVPTEFASAIELPDGRRLSSQEELLLEIYNDVQKIKRSIA